jgi:hypothetical protein
MGPLQIVIRKTGTDGIGNVFKGFISALGIHDDVTIECNPAYVYGNYDTILDDAFIFKGDLEKRYEYFYTCRLLVQKSEENLQETIPNEFTGTDGCQNENLNHLFSFSKLIDWNYDAGLICNQVQERILRSIDRIRFKDVVLQEVDRLRAQIQVAHQTLAISVRTWRAGHEHNVVRPYDYETYRAAISGILELNPQVRQAVLSVDNDSYAEEYVKLLESKNVRVIALKKDGRLNPLQFAIVKVLVLSGCDYLVANRISTFSELVFWFSRCKIKVSPLF